MADATDREPAGSDAVLRERLPEYLPALAAFVRVNLPADVRARESCSDLAQSICRELLAQPPGFEWRGPEAFRAFLFEWALHKIRDRAKFHRAEKRAQRREIDPADGEALRALYASVGTPSAGAIARESVALLEQAFDRLDADDRQVIGLCRIAGLSRGEAAAILGKSPGAVRVHLSRALVRLGAALEQLGVTG